MTPTGLVTDTHPLVWYLGKEHRKLSKKVKTAFDSAVVGKTIIWVPTAVLWEFSLLIKCGRVEPVVPLHTLVAEHFYASAIRTLDMTPDDVMLAHRLNFTSDPWDSMIVAAALRMDCPLITKDTVIHERRPCQIYWD